MTVDIDRRRFVLEVEPEITRSLQRLLDSTTLTLASGSPRRRQILKLAGLKFEVVVPDIEENNPGITDPCAYASSIARRKLENVHTETGITIAADTIVVLDDQILGKPVDREDARRILGTLSGRRHYVVTAVAIRDELSRKTADDYEKSYVTFRELSNGDIENYIDSGEPTDKAGAYGIQGMGELLVSKLEGRLDTVIGFPMNLFLRLVEEIK